jgi:putative ABC transport system permease protein
MVPRLKDTGMNLTVLAFVFGVSVLTSIVFGIAPAISGSRANLNETLKQAGSAAGVSRSRGRLRSLLIVSEVALALVLLTGTGLMVKSLWQMHVSSSLVAPDRVLISGLQIRNPRFQRQAEQAEFLSGFVARVESLPGVRAAAIYRGGSLGVLRIEGRPRPTAENAVSVTYIPSDPSLFSSRRRSPAQGPPLRKRGPRRHLARGAGE